MQLDTFRNLFSPEWFEAFEPFLKTKEFATLWNQIASDAKKDSLYPYSAKLKHSLNNDEIENCIFKAFKITPFNELKVIIVGQSPYAVRTRLNASTSIPESDGLALSSRTKMQPHLSCIYDGLQTLTKIPLKREHDLTFMAEQGILLLNAALTTRYSMPTIHLDVWKPFMDFFFKEIVAKKDSLHIVFMGGREVNAYGKMIEKKDNEMIQFPNTHWVYEDKHPMAYARKEQPYPPYIFEKIARDTGVYFDEVLKEELPF
jgi:uracil DNA glycosylase